MNLEPLAQYGVVGICLGLIILIAFIIRGLFKLVDNHIEHTNDAILENTKVLTSTKDLLNINILASKENIEVTRTLKDYLIMSNGKKRSRIK